MNSIKTLVAFGAVMTWGAFGCAAEQAGGDETVATSGSESALSYQQYKFTQPYTGREVLTIAVCNDLPVAATFVMPAGSIGYGLMSGNGLAMGAIFTTTRDLAPQQCQNFTEYGPPNPYATPPYVATWNVPWSSDGQPNILCTGSLQTVGTYGSLAQTFRVNFNYQAFNNGGFGGKVPAGRALSVH